MKKNLKKVGFMKSFIAARNVKPSFSWGLILGIIFTGIDQILFKRQITFHLKT